MKIYRAFETGDRAVLDSFIPNDILDHAGPNGMPFTNGDSLKTMLANMNKHVTGLKVNVITAAANNDYIFSYVQFTGTAADSTWGKPAGTSIDEKSVDLVRVKDGKMVEHWGFMDQGDVMKKMQEMQSNKKMDTSMEPSKMKN